MLQRYFLLFYFVTSFFPSLLLAEDLARAPILALYGTSTSGKTTILNAIKTSYPGEIRTLGLDTKIQSLLQQMENSQYSASFQLALQRFTKGEIFTALVRKEVDIRHNGDIVLVKIDRPMNEILADAQRRSIQLSDRDIRGIEALQILISKSVEVLNIDPLNYENVFVAIVKEAVENSKLGIPSILDLAPLTFEDFRVHEVFRRVLLRDADHGPSALALVFCPLRELVARILARNKKAEIDRQYDELREGVFPLFQYAQLYTAHEPGVHLESEVIDSISYRDLVDSVRELWSGPRRESITQRLVDALGVKKDSDFNYSVRSHIDYDILLLNLSQNSTSLFLLQLMEFLLNQKK